MSKLLNDIEKLEFITGDNFSYDLDREFKLISLYLDSSQLEYLKIDFNRFLDKGQFVLLNTFGGGLLFLKVPEPIENIKIELSSESSDFEASVVFKSDLRRSENIKYKPNAGKTETIHWNVELMFPNFQQYQMEIKKALLLIIGKIVKRFCEYGRTNFAYINIENEFTIELFIDNQINSILNVEMN